MLWLPSPGRTGVVSNMGAVGSTTLGTGVPGNATTLLDGAVTELIPAGDNVQDSWGIGITVTGTGLNGTIAEAALDILIGGATDDVLIAALLCGYARHDATFGAWSWFFPIHIPAGVRIAGRFASVRTSITAGVVVALYGGGTPPFRVGRKVTTYGTQVNNCRGVSLTIAASGGAASATEIVASTTEDHFAFLPGFQAETDTTLSGDGLINIGIGVGASTEDRIGTWIVSKTSGESMAGMFPNFPAFANVPSGSRLTILGSNYTSNDAAYGGLIYAVS
jgi:hypothetical protein